MNSSCSFTTDLRNSSDLFNYIYRPHELILYTFVTPCIILIGFIGNTSFIWTVVRVSSLHTSTFIVLCSLAFTDLITLTGIGMYEYNILVSPIRLVGLPILYNIGNTIMVFGFFASVGLVTLVSLERYLAICHPIKHHLMKATKRTVRLSLIIMAVSLSFTGILMPQTLLADLVSCFIWPLDDQFKDYPRQISMVTLMFEVPLTFYIVSNILLLICYLVIFIFNCYMFCAVLITLRRRKHKKTLQISANFERNIQQIATMVITNGMVFFLYSTVFQVDLIFNIMVSFDFIHFGTFVRFGLIRDIAMVLNASSNPPIYFMTNSSYRRAFKASIMKSLGTIRRTVGKEVAAENTSKMTELEDLGKR